MTIFVAVCGLACTACNCLAWIRALDKPLPHYADALFLLLLLWPPDEVLPPASGVAARDSEHLPPECCRECPQEIRLARRQGPFGAVLELHQDIAKSAYTACKKTWKDDCQVPCTDLAGCAGCHPDGQQPPSLVCGFCHVGHVLTADNRCEPCAPGSTSEGGLTRQCQACPAGMTTTSQGTYPCEAKKPTRGSPPARALGKPI